MAMTAHLLGAMSSAWRACKAEIPGRMRTLGFLLLQILQCQASIAGGQHAATSPVVNPERHNCQLLQHCPRSEVRGKCPYDLAPAG